MLRSLNSSVSGMKAFQNKLDVIGNNIANVNTVGFKKSRIVFQDVLSQTVSSGTTPTVNSGGTNPLQIGLGVKIGTVDSIQTPGSPTTTNLSSDLYIDGNGFFAVQDSSDSIYLTRAGNFNRDANGDLVTTQGNKVLGFKYDPNADTFADDPEPINIDSTRFVSYSIDLNGIVTGVMPDGTSEKIAVLGTVVVSNPAGLKKVGGSMYELTGSAQINADFSIPKVEDLIKNKIKNPTHAAGQIVSGQLEMSNVDLSEEITEMIIAQRGFQANAKVINVSDSILEELINLKR